MKPAFAITSTLEPIDIIGVFEQPELAEDALAIWREYMPDDEYEIQSIMIWDRLPAHWTHHMVSATIGIDGSRNERRQQHEVFEWNRRNYKLEIQVSIRPTILAEQDHAWEAGDVLVRVTGADPDELEHKFRAAIIEAQEIVQATHRVMDEPSAIKEERGKRILAKSGVCPTCNTPPSRIAMLYPRVATLVCPAMHRWEYTGDLFAKNLESI